MEHGGDDGASYQRQRARIMAVLLAGTALAALPLGPALGDETWVGGAAGSERDWNSAANWTPATLPTAVDNVLINGGPADKPLIGAGVSAFTNTLEVGTTTFSGNILDISGGGTLTANSVIAGSLQDGAGTVTVSGAGSSATVATTVWLGLDGIGTLSISSGGAVQSAAGGLGTNFGGVGMVTVSGAGSTWDMTNNLDVGDGGEGYLSILNGADVTADSSSLGSAVGASGTAVVDGAGSTWTMNSNLVVGNAGTGDLTISNGGSVSAFRSTVGFTGGASYGTVTVDGAGSTWTTDDELIIGDFGSSEGSVLVSNGGLANADTVTLANSAAADGSMTVSGAGSQLVVAQSIDIGLAGQGDFTISNGGAASNNSTFIGRDFGHGTALVTGAGSTWNMTNDLLVGLAGGGSMTIAAGADVVNGGVAYVGSGTTGEGSMLVTGAGSTWQVTGPIAVGNFGSGQVTVADGGAVSSSSAVHIAINADSHGALNIGAAAGDAAAAAGSVSAPLLGFGLGTGSLDFNHTDAAYAFSTQMLSLNANATIHQLSGTTILSADNSGFLGTTTVSGGTLLVNNLLGGTVNVTGGNLGGSGTVGALTVGAGGTVAPGNSIGTLVVDGNATFGAGSTFAVEVDDQGNSDRLHSNYAVTIESGASVSVAPENGIDTGMTYADGTKYLIISAYDGVTGTFGSVTDTFAFLSPVLSYDANDVYVTLFQTSNFTAAAVTPNQLAAAGGAENQGSGDAVYDGVLGLATADAPGAFDALSGEAHASLKGVLIEDSAFVRDAVLGRLAAAAAAPETAGAAMGYAGDAVLSGESAYGGGVWGQLYGGLGNIAADGNAALSDFTSGGLVLGADGELGDWRLGAVAHAGTTGLSIPDRDTTGTSINYGLGLYGGMQWGDTGLKFGAAYARHAISTTREVAFPGFAETLTASYGAATGQAFGELSHQFDFGNVELTPFVQAAHVHHATDAFTEQGGTAALASAASVAGGTFTTLGLRGSHRFVAGEDGLGTLTGGVAWRHAFADLPTATQSFAGGAAFTVAGAPIAADALVLEAGLDLDLANGMDLVLSYDGQLAAAGQSHALKAGVGGQF